MSRKIREGVICADVCGEHMLVATFKARPYCRKRAILLNETGYQLMQFLQKGYSVDEMVQSFTKQYGSDGTQTERDIKTFFENMEKEGFVEKYS